MTALFVHYKVNKNKIHLPAVFKLDGNKLHIIQIIDDNLLLSYWKVYLLDRHVISFWAHMDNIVKLVCSEAAPDSCSYLDCEQCPDYNAGNDWRSNATLAPVPASLPSVLRTTGIFCGQNQKRTSQKMHINIVINSLLNIFLQNNIRPITNSKDIQDYLSA